MNAQPHTHKINLRTAYSDGSGGWLVEYGDTQVYVTVLGHVVWLDHVQKLPSDWRIRRAVRKAIRRHDKGSVRAGHVNDRRTTVVEEMNAKLAGDEWASKVLA